ncbi:MAG: type VI secretion system baseplate subunit TssK [Gemmatimonadota bacterium]|jgi:type VI secretion system protein ImpJ|nr:type VI secretion system baseplate subunit TssK [Gemmatimonadota bacterium]
MRKVLWSKGVLLTPQHLQMQDRFVEETIGFQISALSFFPWGFSGVDIDREALTGGLLTLRSASGLFPDGMPFEMPRSDPPPPPRPLGDAWRPDQRTMDAWLTIPEHRAGGHNVSATTEGRNTRFRSEVVLRRDENTGLAEKPVQIARKNFGLVLEGESLEGYIALPLARIIRSETGKLELDEHFVPPLVSISGSDYLVAITRRLVELLSARSGTLSGQRRQRNQGLADFGVSDIANFWLLYTINSYLPQLRHLYETRKAHPGELFSVMSSLASALTTFSTRIHPRTLPSYRHTDLQSCFTSLDTTLRELLETVVPANHAVLPLRSTGASIHAAAIDRDSYLSSSRMYLAIQTAMKPDELIRKVPQLLKVSSSDQVERLIRQASVGLTLRHVPNPPAALPVKLNYQYFQLEQSGPEWSAICRSRNIAAYIPAEFPEPQAELVVLLPAE